MLSMNETEMSTSPEGDAIETHGTALDAEKRRVKCCYCQKEVSGFNRLKHHLGDVGSDVTGCTEVPPHLKSQMRVLLLGKKKERLLKEVDSVEHPELPLRRISTHVSHVDDQHQLTPNLSAAPKKRKMEGNDLRKMNDSGNSGPDRPRTQQQGPPMAVNYNVIVKEEVKGEPISHAERCIGRFFFDAGIDPALTTLPSFQKMIDSIISCGAGYRVPHYDGLKGHVLQDELREINLCVEEIKRAWIFTGCSILLDSWTDKAGRELIRFLASCRRGMVFLRSVVVTDTMRNADTLYLLVSKVIEEIGPQNVVQVVAHNSSDIVENAGKKIMKKYGSIFWTLCADFSVNLILEKIEAMNHVGKVLNDAKKLTRFIYGNMLTFELMKKYITGGDLVKSGNLKSVASFITLKNIISQKNHLIGMFSSAMWLNSSLASEKKGKHITKLVKDYQFWDACIDILKITEPILGILHCINGIDKPPMGFLYDAMDRSKEEIKRNVADNQAKYEPVWEIVDDIWDNELHSSLHAAGYYLNPQLFFSKDFYLDSEVSLGIMYSNVRMAEDQHDQEKIIIQLNNYKEKRGGFGQNMEKSQLACMSPDMWWLAHGSQCPELQRWAIRILSQTCSSATRYMLNNDISEKLHSEKLNCIEEQRLRDMEYVSNNRCLWQAQSSCNIETMFCHEILNPSDNWIVED